MKQQEILSKLAELVVKKGINLQKGQPVVVNSPLEAMDLARAIAEAAYKAGASFVNINYDDNMLARYGYLYQSEAQLKEVPEWVIERMLYVQSKGAAMISIASPNTEAMKGVDVKKMNIFHRAIQAHPKFAQIMGYTMSNQGQWCVCSYPNEIWAKKVFPSLSVEKAYAKLWKAIIDTSRVTGGKSPIDNWNKHNKECRKRADILNKYNFKSLHYKNKLGTDFDIELVPNHIWAGGSEDSAKGIEFNPNIPTEEVFTAPNKKGANGKVVSTKPLFFNGKLIEGFWIEFKDGKAIKFGAKKEKETLKGIIENDPGSCYLGEVALVPFNSPISQSGILFYNTLFDENASCHLALGMAYPSSLKGGIGMSREQQAKAGLNQSSTHVDFMIGSKDLEIVGTTQDGKKVQVFKNGNFVF